MAPLTQTGSAVSAVSVTIISLHANRARTPEGDALTLRSSLGRSKTQGPAKLQKMNARRHQPTGTFPHLEISQYADDTLSSSNYG